MREFKGTQGEWIANKDKYEGYSVVLNDNDPIGVTFIAEGVGQGEDEGFYDAQLIAAAPELLNVMQSAYKCSGERNTLTKPVLDDMLAAINKALGINDKN
jgi:hypothetical protein